MTRSSWHHYWRLMTGFSVLMCVLFVLAAVGNEKVPGQSVLAGGPASVQFAYYAFAQALATLLALFWGIVSVAFGLAWWACAMALAERRSFETMLHAKKLAEREIAGLGMEDVQLRS